MKVFVAGATGVLGTRAVRDLVAAGHEVTGIARSEAKAALLSSLGATPVQVDLFDPPALTAAVAGHDAVLNLATHVPPLSKAAVPGAWKEHERIRTEGARNLVDAALAAGAELYVQESLAFAYTDGGTNWIDEDHPLLPGGVAGPVRAAEAEVARFTAGGGRGVALRFGQFYVPDSTYTVALVQAARRGVSTNVGVPDAHAPMISGDDAARAVVAALGAPSGTYNVVDDEPLTRREGDVALARAVGVRKLRRPPSAALRFGGPAAQVFVASARTSNARFKAATGWAPRQPSVREGFRTLAAAVPGERTPLLASVFLLVLAVTDVFLGVYATFFPRGFYDEFPSGRGWVAADGPYNEHLVRDFGALNLALALVAVIALVKGGRWLLTAAAGSSLVFGVPHFAYHLGHLDPYEGFDKVANIVTLGFGVVLAAAVVLSVTAAGRPPARRSSA